MEKIRNHPRIFFAGALLLILFSLLALTAVGALARPTEPEANYGMTWDVFASGGTTMSSTHYRMLSTAGQPLTAVSTSTNRSLKSGYWYGLQDVVRRLFLPLVNREN
jgi:hypothetical protein